MAEPVRFATDDQILAALKQTHSLSYIAALLHTSMERIRSLRDQHKTAIVQARLDAGQTIEGICFHLELLIYLDRMREWHKRVQDLKHTQEQDHA